MKLQKKYLLLAGSSGLVVMAFALPALRGNKAAAAIAAPPAALPKPAANKPLAMVDFKGVSTFNKLLARAERLNYSKQSIGDLVGSVGLNFAGTKYENYTLEKHPDTEICTVNLKSLDCVTFVETSLAMARLLKKNETTPRDLADEVSYIRYRDGNLDGFASRLHYLTDWVDDNGSKGVIKDITSTLPGAKPYEKKVSLMSARPKEYVQLRKHPELIPAIAKFEKQIATRKHFYVPKANFAQAEPSLQTGDVIAITTSASILDCTHTGICYRDKDNKVRFMHASSKHHKVYIDTTLADYLAEKRYDTGIIVARPQELVTGQ